MRRLLLCLIASLVLISGGARAQDAPQRVDVVEALLARSRLLDDVAFTVPVDLWRDYLREQAEAAGIEEPSPVPFIVSEADYHLALQGDLDVRLTATVHVHVFRPADARSIAALSTQVAWQEVRVNDRPADLAAVDGLLRLTPDQPGELVVTATTRLSGTEAIDLPIARSVRTFVRFDALGAYEFTAEGAAGALRGTAEGGTHGRLALTACERLKSRWETLRDRFERPPRYQLSGDVVWNLAAGSQQVEAALRMGIVGGSSERIDLRLPPEAERVRVTGPDVRDVQTAPGRATVFLRGKIPERTRLRVSFELPAARNGTARLDGIGADDGHWAGGTLVVTSSSGATEVLPQTAGGLEETGLTQIPDSASAMMAAAPAQAYRITSRQWSVSVETLDLGEYALRETVADIAHYELTVRPDGTMMVRAAYEIRNRTQQFIRFDLPPGAQVLQVHVNEKPQPLTPLPGAADAYQVPLVRSTASVKGLVSFPVEIVLLSRTAPLGPAGRAALHLPRINIPIAYAWCEAWLPTEMEPRRWTGPMRRVERYSSETATASLEYGSATLAEGYEEAKRPTVARAAVEEAADALRPTTGEEVVYTVAGRAGAGEPAKPEEEAKPHQAFVADLEPVVSESGVTFAPAQPQAAPEAPVPEDRPTTVQPPGGVPTAAHRSLARNYFRAGRDFYEQGDFDNAATSFENALKLAPGSVEATNASRLLGNIRSQRGEAVAQGKAEKAAAAQVAREVTGANVAVIQEQKKLVEQAEVILRHGDQVKGVAKLKAAEALGEKLLKQGVDLRDTSRRQTGIQKRLAKLTESQAATAQSLEKQADVLKEHGRFEEALRLRQRSAQIAGKDVARKELTELAYQAELQKAELQQVERIKSQIVADVQAEHALERERSSVKPTTTVETLDGVTTRRFAGYQQRTYEYDKDWDGPPGVPPPRRQRTPGPETDPRAVKRDPALLHRELERAWRRSQTETALAEGETSAVPWNEIHRYPSPKEWEKLTERRRRFVAGASTKADAVGATRRKLTTKDIVRGEDWSISLSLTATGLGNVLDFIAEAARAKPREINIIIDRKGIQQAGIGLDDPIDLNIKDVSIQQALKMVLGEQLGYAIRGDGTVVVSARERFARAKPAFGYWTWGTVDKVPDFGDRVPRMDLAGVLPQRITGTGGGALFADERVAAPVPDAPEDTGVTSRIEKIDVASSMTSEYRRLDERLLTRTYDVRGLNLGDSDGDQARQIQSMVGGVLRTAGDQPNLMRVVNGQAVVTTTSQGQYQVQSLLRNLETAQGPQVQKGQALALQQARRSGDGAWFYQNAPATTAGSHITTSTVTVLDLGARYNTNFRGAMDTDGGWGYDNAARPLRRVVPVRTVTPGAWDPKISYWVDGPRPEGAPAWATAQPEAARDAEFQRFVRDNYDWALRGQTGGGGGAAPLLGDVPVVGRTFSNLSSAPVLRRTFSNRADLGGGEGGTDVSELARKLRLNLGQQVRVNSIDLNVARPQAAALGIDFATGKNALRYATIDEAQFRTLAELSARRPSVAAGDQSRSQFTIVGTDALMTNGMLANVTFAGDERNTLDINGNGIALPHERYIVVDNGRYLTAVRADPMQHWTEKPSSLPFAVVPQTVDVPRVGRRLKLEKTLVEPTDELVLRVEYTWKGATR